MRQTKIVRSAARRYTTSTIKLTTCVATVISHCEPTAVRLRPRDDVFRLFGTRNAFVPWHVTGIGTSSHFSAKAMIVSRQVFLLSYACRAVFVAMVLQLDCPTWAADPKPDAAAAKQKEEMQTFLKAVEHWRPLVIQWRRAVDGEKAALPADAREEIVAMTASIEMLGLQKSLWQQVGRKPKEQQPYRLMCRELIRVLAENKSPAATECLARLSVLSNDKDVRRTAALELKGRPQVQYVPLLLSLLCSPFEAAEQRTLDAAGNPATRFVVEQEGAEVDLSLSQTRTDGTYNAAAIRNTIEATNRNIERNNARIIESLACATGVDVGTEPKQWWQWWQDQNVVVSAGTQDGMGPNDDAYAPQGGSRKPVIQFDYTPPTAVRRSSPPPTGRSQSGPGFDEHPVIFGGGVTIRGGGTSHYSRHGDGTHWTLHRYCYTWSGDPSHMTGWDRKWSR